MYKANTLFDYTFEILEACIHINLLIIPHLHAAVLPMLVRSQERNLKNVNLCVQKSKMANTNPCFAKFKIAVVYKTICSLNDYTNSWLNI